MKYRTRPKIVDAVRFDAPDANHVLDAQERRVIESRYSVHSVGTQSGSTFYRRWIFRNPTRLDVQIEVAPGDYIVTKQDGDREVWPAAAFEAVHEPLEEES